MGEHYVRIDQGGGNDRVRGALLRQIKAVFNLAYHLLVFLAVHLLRLLHGGRFSSCWQVLNQPPVIVYIIVTTSQEFRVGICWVLGVTQQRQCRAVLKLKVALGNRRRFFPVSILAGYLLKVDLALPTVVTTKCSRYLQALVRYENPVALSRPGALQLVYEVREHQDHKVPQSPLVAYPPVLVYSGGISIVTDVILRSDMELTGSPRLHPAQHLEAVTKIKMVKSVCPGLP